jgi:hypothetical protein
MEIREGVHLHGAGALHRAYCFPFHHVERGAETSAVGSLFVRLSILVWAGSIIPFIRRNRRRTLSFGRHKSMVPILLPHGGDPRIDAENRQVQNTRETGDVHFLRHVQHLLRDGHRCKIIRTGGRKFHARLLRRLRLVRRSLSEGRTAAGK